MSATLLAQELPAEVSDQMLGVLFGRFAGFQSVRVVEGRGLAFIEVRTCVRGLRVYVGLVWGVV